MPATADAQRAAVGLMVDVASDQVGGSGVVVGRPVMRGTVVRPTVVRLRVIVRRPIVAGSVPAGHLGRIGFGTVPVRTGFGTVPVRTRFEVAPVGAGFVRSSRGFVHAGTGFVHAPPGARSFREWITPRVRVEGFREHKRGQFFWGGVVGYPAYPYYPSTRIPTFTRSADIQPPRITTSDYLSTSNMRHARADTPQAYDTPQTCGGDYGAGGVSAGLSTYFMDLGNQNQSALTFDVWPVTTEVFVDGV